MSNAKLSPWALGLAAAFGLALPGAGAAQAAKTYPTMAPVGDYLMADRAKEIAFARTAAPPSISADAEVLVLTAKGYVSGAPGKNGFVCMVQRAWFSGLEDTGFWNPKLRAPVCFNQQAARSVLPVFMTRTNWAMSGVSQAEIAKRTHAAMAAGKVPTPSVGAMTLMMSKDGYLGDVPHGPWHSHVMFYMPPMKTSEWGADLPGSPIASSAADGNPWTMFYIPVAKWSDGTADAAAHAGH
ncbi:hypothetical protein [Phenylobacterium sp.]|jgi:hypothetical protein|uniref:hypothetical protein n=1 Tax=Phenylobacterium sp. TaxID=1871053 RepID=UPI002F41E36C